METVNINIYFEIFKIQTIEKITLKELKRRWRILLLKYHPDKPGGDGNKTILINDAYSYIVARRKEFEKKESKKFFNKNFYFYGDGSIYNLEKKRWIKFKGNIINVES